MAPFVLSPSTIDYNLGFNVVRALLAARHSVAVADCSCPSLSFYVVALLPARHSVVVDCSGPSLSFYIVAELAVVKTYHYDFLPLPLNLKLYVTIYIPRSIRPEK